MEYTVQKLGNMAGVSTRTLRYYDEVGILKPARINSSGYRIYGQVEVDRLQQVLFYRELGVSIEEIKDIVTSETFDITTALREHHEKLLTKRHQLDQLIANVEKTMSMSEGRIKMSDKEKFEGFKKNMVEENEKKYGKEIREKYGEDSVKASNAKMMKMTEVQYAEFEQVGKELEDTLEAAYQTGDPAGELGQKAAELHRKWLSFTWNSYSKEAHAGLARMYVEDERFTAYYDKKQPGTAVFLRDAILLYTGMKD